MIIYFISTLFLFLLPILQIFNKIKIFYDFSYLLIYLIVLSVLLPFISSEIIGKITKIAPTLNRKYTNIFILINIIISILLLVYVLENIFNNFPTY